MTYVMEKGPIARRCVAYMNELLSGDERDLLGYWPMNEGTVVLPKIWRVPKTWG